MLQFLRFYRKIMLFSKISFVEIFIKLYMKHKLKEFLLLQFLIGTLFVSCSLEEEVVRNDNYNSKYQVKQQSYSELIKVTTFKNAMDKIPKVKKSNLLNGKTIMEEQYGFTIIDAPIKITETDEIIAYNLLVKSDTISQGNYFENLVVNINKQTETIKAYIVKYNIGNNDLTLTSHNSFIFIQIIPNCLFRQINGYFNKVLPKNMV